MKFVKEPGVPGFFFFANLPIRRLRPAKLLRTRIFTGSL